MTLIVGIIIILLLFSRFFIKDIKEKSEIKAQESLEKHYEELSSKETPKTEEKPSAFEQVSLINYNEAFDNIKKDIENSLNFKYKCQAKAVINNQSHLYGEPFYMTGHESPQNSVGYMSLRGSDLWTEKGDHIPFHNIERIFFIIEEIKDERSSKALSNKAPESI